MKTTTDDEPEPPPALVAAVEKALAPYKALLSPETVEAMRRAALLQLASHPYPAALTRALSTPTVVQESAVVDLDGRGEGDPREGAA